MRRCANNLRSWGLLPADMLFLSKMGAARRHSAAEAVRAVGMIVFSDNYDSFTFNLVHYLGELGADVVVHRNDKVTSRAVMAAEPDALVLSPGPCTPKEAVICLDLSKEAAPKIPIRGVCLGHQAIGDAFGGKVIRAPVLVHGKLSEIRHQGQGIFRGINGPFKATRYHSLIVERANLPR